MSHRTHLHQLARNSFAPAILTLSAWAVGGTQATTHVDEGPSVIAAVRSDARPVRAAGAEFVLGVRDGHLVFPTVQDYRNVVDDPDEDTRQSFLRAAEELGDVQLLVHSHDAALARIEDDYFRSILNTDGIVEIGDHIFKVAPTTGQVLALRAADREQLGALVAGDHSVPGVRVFSTDDDVLDVLEPSRGGMLSPLCFGCSETSIGGSDKSSPVKLIPGSSPSVNMQASVHYNKFGIYFSLFGKLDVGANSNVEIKLDLEPVRYKPRCQSVTGPYNQYNYQSVAGQHWQTQRWQSYQGSRALNEVRIRACGKAYVGGSTTPAATTDWVEYRKNC